VRPVQSTISNFEFKMQESSNFKFLRDVRNLEMERFTILRH